MSRSHDHSKQPAPIPHHRRIRGVFQPRSPSSGDWPTHSGSTSRSRSSDQVREQRRRICSVRRRASQLSEGSVSEESPTDRIFGPHSWFDPFFQLGFDLRKSTRDQSFARGPKLTPVHWNCPYCCVRRKSGVVSGLMCARNHAGRGK